MPNIFIGFAGFARSGKGTAAAAAVAELHSLGFEKVVIMSIADSLRKLMIAFNPYIKKSNARYNKILEKYGYEESKKLPGFRDALVDMGEAVRRTFGQDVWMTALIKRANEEFPGYVVIIDDVRYKNESETIQALGGKVARIIRDSAKPAHITEEESLKGVVADYTIFNNTSIEDFRVAVWQVVDEWINGTKT